MAFVVQLSCLGSGYLPTARAVRGGGYSADAFLVEESVKRINALWP